MSDYKAGTYPLGDVENKIKVSRGKDFYVKYYEALPEEKREILRNEHKKLSQMDSLNPNKDISAGEQYHINNFINNTDPYGPAPKTYLRNFYSDYYYMTPSEKRKILENERKKKELNIKKIMYQLKINDTISEKCHTNKQSPYANVTKTQQNKKVLINRTNNVKIKQQKINKVTNRKNIITFGKTKCELLHFMNKIGQNQNYWTRKTW